MEWGGVVGWGGVGERRERGREGEREGGRREREGEVGGGLGSPPILGSRGFLVGAL